MDPQTVRMIAAAACIAVGAIGPAIAIAFIGHAAMQALGRNPEGSRAIMTNMILAIAFAEAIAIYALIVAIIIAMII